MMRRHDASDEEEDEDYEEDEVRDPLNRAAGRVQVAPADQPAIPGGAKAGYQYEPPQHGGSLMRWRIKATFPTGPKNELRWHDGFVFDHNQLEREEGEGVEYQYTLFFPIDATDEVVSAPFNGKDICFRKQHLPDPKASEREMKKARAVLCSGAGSDESE